MKSFVIGGTGGIGIAISKALSKKGEVFVSYYGRREEAEKRVRESGVSVKGMYEVDVTSEESVRKAVSGLKEVDVVVHCASIPVFFKRFRELSWKDYQKHIDVQVKGMFNIVKAFYPMIEKKEKMKFIAVVSAACIGDAPAMLSDYVSAKYGLMGFMKAMASELGKSGCSFNMVSPDFVDTGLVKNIPEKLVEMTAEQSPTGRLTKPEDVAKAVMILVEKDFNGKNIAVIGGEVSV